MSKEKPPKNHQDYEVGYGKPPKSKRFKPGASGNPKGRPKGKKSRHNSADTHALMALFLQNPTGKSLLPRITLLRIYLWLRL